jgi:hypothetical protein
MMALGMILCSMVCDFDIYLNRFGLFYPHKNGGKFPESPGDVKNLLSRFGFLSLFGRLLNIFKRLDKSNGFPALRGHL